MFTIKERMFMIEYEGTHMLCLSCGRFGHYNEGCPKRKLTKDVSDSEGDNGGLQRNGIIDVGELSTCPWSVVHKQRKGRKVAFGLKNQAMGNINGDQVLLGSRFTMLSNETPEINDTINTNHVLSE